MGKLADAIASYGRWLDEGDRTGGITFSISCESRGTTDVTVSLGRHTISADEPKSLGGGDTAPTPVGYLIAALGSCAAIGLSYWSDILGIPYDSAEVVVEGEINPAGAYALRHGVSPSFSDLSMDIRVTGPESEDRYQDLMAKVESYSPLLETLRQPMTVPIRLSVST